MGLCWRSCFEKFGHWRWQWRRFERLCLSFGEHGRLLLEWQGPFLFGLEFLLEPVYFVFEFSDFGGMLAAHIQYVQLVLLLLVERCEGQRVVRSVH